MINDESPALEVHPILTAAAELFDSCGYETTMEQIAARAGVDISACSARYATQTAVEAAIVDTFHELLPAMVLARAARAGAVGNPTADWMARSLPERIHEWMDAIRDLARDHPALVRYALAARGLPWVARHVRASDRRMKRLFAYHLARPGLPDPCTNAVFHCLALFMLGRLTEPTAGDQLSEQDVVDFLIGLVNGYSRPAAPVAARGSE